MLSMALGCDNIEATAKLHACIYLHIFTLACQYMLHGMTLLWYWLIVQWSQKQEKLDDWMELCMISHAN